MINNWINQLIQNDVEKEAFSGCKNLSQIEFSGNSELETIGEGAFRNANLSSITLPNTLQIVRTAAFFINESLDNVTFISCDPQDQDSRLIIEEDAFHYCGSLRSVKFPKQLKKIGNSAFSKCHKLDVVLANLSNLELIGPEAFRSCQSVNLELGCLENLSKIGDSAFEETKSLGKIVFPVCVIELGEKAFKNCDINQKEVILPKALQGLGKGCFQSSYYGKHGISALTYKGDSEGIHQKVADYNTIFVLRRVLFDADLLLRTSDTLLNKDTLLSGIHRLVERYFHEGYLRPETPSLLSEILGSFQHLAIFDCLPINQTEGNTEERLDVDFPDNIEALLKGVDAPMRKKALKAFLFIFSHNEYKPGEDLLHFIKYRARLDIDKFLLDLDDNIPEKKTQ